MKQRYSIKPILREDKIKQNGQAPLYFSVILNKRVIRIPTGKSISIQNWDKEKSKVKGAGLANELNQFLTTKVNEFQTFMLQQETLGKVITPDFVKGYFEGNSTNSFYEFWQQQIKRSNLKPITLKNYETTFNRLKEFHPNPTFADLTYEFVQGFNNYLRHKRGNTVIGANTRHKCLKAMIRIAVKSDIIEKNPYINFPLKNVQLNPRVFLTIQEVKKIEAAQIPEKKSHLLKLRDTFLFSCYTGLRYSDIYNLRLKDIQAGSIKLNMQKTQKEVFVPLIPQAIAILDKYSVGKVKKETKIFPMASNQKCNKGLKALIELAEIKKSVSFHCSRHTFASLHVLLKTPLIEIRDLLGHTSTKQTEIYAKTLKENLVNSMLRMERLIETK